MLLRSLLNNKITLREILKSVKWFDLKINSHLDLDSFTIEANTPIYYTNEVGLLKYISVKSLLKHLEQGKQHLPKGSFAKDELEKLFCRYFRKEDNFDIDFGNVSARDTKTKIIYRDIYDRKREITPYTFITNVEANNGIFIPPIYGKDLFIADDPVFMEWFNPSLNPDLDPKKHYKNSTTQVRFYRKDGRIGSISISWYYRLIRKYGHFVEGGYRKKRRKSVYMKDIPEFLLWVDMKINNKLDLSTLKQTDARTWIYYYHEGELCKIHPVGWVKNYNRNNGTIKLIQNTKVTKEKKDSLYAWDYPEFRKYYDPALNPGIDPLTLKRHDRKTMITIRISEHVTKEIKVKNFFTNLFLHNGKYSYGGVPKEESVANCLPETLLFCSDADKMILYTLNRNSAKILNWTCPFCKYEFPKSIKAFANSHPKCPRCKDQSKICNPINLPDSVGFLIKEERTRV